MTRAIKNTNQQPVINFVKPMKVTTDNIFWNAKAKLPGEKVKYAFRCFYNCCLYCMSIPDTFFYKLAFKFNYFQILRSFNNQFFHLYIQLSQFIPVLNKFLIMFYSS